MLKLQKQRVTIALSSKLIVKIDKLSSSPDPVFNGRSRSAIIEILLFDAVNQK